MKKPILSRLFINMRVALLLTGIALIINSCRKDSHFTGQQAINPETPAHFSVTDAKEWFTINKTAQATKLKLNSQTSFLSKFANFTPVWDSARTAADTNLLRDRGTGQVR